MKPQFKIDLPGSEWCLVITSTGHRFYHNSLTGQSEWNYPNDTVAELVHGLDRNQILILIAKARGLKIGNDGEGNKRAEKREGFEKAWDTKEGNKNIDKNVEIFEKSEKFDSNEKSEKFGKFDNNENTKVLETTIKDKSSAPLLTGYASSDDSDDSDDSDNDNFDNKISKEKAEESESSEYESDSEESDSEESDVENGINLDELESSDEEDKQKEQQVKLTNEQINSRENFFQLMEEHLNPYGIWEEELKKIINDARFLEIELDQERKALFDDWCTLKAAASNESPSQEAQLGEESSMLREIDISKLDLLAFTPSTEYNPVILYFAFLMKNYRPNKFYVDFKRKHRANPEFKDNELTDKQKERLYQEFAALKKKSIAERKDILSDFLVNSKVFLASVKSLTKDAQLQANALKLVEKLQDFWSTDEKLKQMPIDDAKLVVKHVEHLLEMPESIRENTIYFAVPTKDRLQLLYQVYSILLQRS